MRNNKRLLAALLTICLMLSVLPVFEPVQVKAADTITINAENGYVYITNLGNDYKDGKFRFNLKFEYEKYGTASEKIVVDFIKLENSKGKVVATWPGFEGLSKGGSITKHYGIDFSSYPSDTYKFKYSVWPTGTLGYKTYTITVKHTAGSIKYKKSYYSYDTNGNKTATIVFNCKKLKGYTPKFEVYDSKGKLVYSRTCYSKVPSDNTDYSCTWDFYANGGGLKVDDGKYTFKLTCNGKSVTKKLNVQTE